MNQKLRPVFTAAFLAFVAALPCARAIDLSGIAIHGSLDTSESESDKYNFYGATADRFDNNLRELTLNGGYRWADGLRVSAQFYAYDIDDTSSLDLDFANLDYSFAPWLGLRLGRNKSAIGLYGDTQDLDQVRTFANLPLAFYPLNTRPLNYTDGFQVYGSISAGRGGSFDYTAMFGKIEHIPDDLLISGGSGGLTSTDGYSIPAVYGLSVFWTTPVSGLRFGLSYESIPHIGVTAHLTDKEFATLPGLTYSATPISIDQVYGIGAWDARFAGTPADSIIGLAEEVASVEYTVGKFVIAAEYKREPEHIATSIPALGVKNSYALQRPIATYAMVTYQATKQLGLGLYYSYSDNDAINAARVAASVRQQNDVAGVICYAPLPWWLFKVEYHQMHGLGLVDSAGDTNTNAPTAGNSWNYLVFKTTVSF